MKLGSLVLLLALVTAPACGGGASSITDPGGSPSPLAASFVPDNQPTPPARNTVAMTEEEKTPVDDVVTVNVTLTDANGVFGAAFEVAFDSTQTAYLGYTTGNALEQGGDTPNYTVTSSPDRLIVGVARSSRTATNVSGTKTILGLRFRVNQAGVYPLSIENAGVYDQSSPLPIPGIAWFAGAVTGV